MFSLGCLFNVIYQMYVIGYVGKEKAVKVYVLVLFEEKPWSNSVRFSAVKEGPGLWLIVCDK